MRGAGPCLAGSDAVQNKERIVGSGESKQELISDVRSMNLLPASVNEETTDNAGFVSVASSRTTTRQAFLLPLTAGDATGTAQTLDH
jgi:hypothetical protein